MAYVLIIDNDELMRSVLVQKFTKVGITTKQANDGLQGLQMAKEEHPAVIVLDEHMPQMNGQQFVVALQKEDWYKQVHIVVFTSFSDVDLMNHKMLAGVQDYLNKGTVTPETVVQAARKYLPPVAP